MESRSNRVEFLEGWIASFWNAYNDFFLREWSVPWLPDDL